MWSQVADGGGLSDDLVDEIEAEQFAEGPSAASGADHGSDAVGGYLVQQGGEQGSGGFDGSALMSLVAEIADGAVVVEQGELAAYRAEVDSQVQRPVIWEVQLQMLGDSGVDNGFAV